MTALQSLNIALAVVGALVAFGAANRMNKHTEMTIAISFATVGAGLIGFALADLWPNGWQETCDTLLLGGIVSLLIGTRRQTIWIPPRWMPRLSYAVAAATWLAFFVGVR